MSTNSRLHTKRKLEIEAISCKKSIKNNGLEDYELQFKEKALMSIITDYTKSLG